MEWSCIDTNTGNKSIEWVWIEGRYRGKDLINWGKNRWDWA